MTNLKINELTISNVRNLQDQTFKFGEINKISGQNGQGKTTILKCIAFLFTGKGEDGRQIGTKGSILRNKDNDMPTIISAIVTIGFMNYKIEVEITKKDEKIYRINDDKLLKKDFDSWISSNICNEELFQVLSIPTFFNEKVDNLKARALFMNVLSSKVSIYNTILKLKDADQIKITGLLGTSFEIDDVERKIETIKDFIKNDENKIKTQIDVIASQEDNLQNNAFDGDVDSLLKRREELQGQINSINSQHQQNKIIFNREIELKKEKSELEIKIKQLETNYNPELEQIKTQIVNLESQKQQATTNWQMKNTELTTLKAAQFDTTMTKCNSCGQDLQTDKIQEIKSNWQANQDQRIANIEQELNVIVENGKNLNLEIDKLNVSKIALEEVSVDEKAIELYEEQIKEIDVKLENNKPIEVADANAIQVELNQINQTLGSQDLIASIKSKIENYKKDLKILQDSKVNNELTKNSLENLINQYLNDISAFINEKFDKIGIELFEVNKSGTIKKVFNVNYKNNAYSTMLSNGEKIAASMELINVMQNELDIKIPILIDNAESIDSSKMNELTKDTQLFICVVENDKKLEVK